VKRFLKQERDEIVLAFGNMERETKQVSDLFFLFVFSIEKINYKLGNALVK